MDLNVLPLAEIDLKIGDDAIKFDNDEDKEDFSEINPTYNPETFDLKNDLHFIKQEVENYEDVNFHFLTRNQKSDPNDPARRYRCEDCGKSFLRNDHLKNHRRTHTGERPYECEFCQRSFAKNFDLSRHKQYVHGSAKTFFACEECGRTFSRKDHLKSHLIFHKTRALKTKETNSSSEIVVVRDRFTCKTCGRAYCRIENLKRHMKKHCENIDSTNCDSNNLADDLQSEDITGKMFQGINFHFMSADEVEPNALRPFVCKFCGRLFVRKDHLVNHERTHTGERPYQCDQCDRRFAKRFVMTRHLQNVHRINSKIYNCPDCDKKFTRTDHLKNHMKIHMLARNPQKDKFHKCSICGSEFTRSDNLKTHMKIHLLAEVRKQQEEEMGSLEGGNDLDYFCNLCQMSFSDFEGFQKHEQMHLKMQTS